MSAAAVVETARRDRAAAVKTPLERVLHAGLIGLVHLPLLAIPFAAPRPQDWVVFVLLYVVNFFSLSDGMHRYFTHRAFRTSRAFQFLMALLAGCFFGDAVEFSGKHRLHHRFSDTDQDPHSPRRGWFHCWLGNLVDDGYTVEERLAAVPDLTRYPELMWLHRWWALVGTAACLAVVAAGGWSMFLIGYCLNLPLRMHFMSAINYFGHRGSGPDLSTNNPLLGLLVFGEGWHHNHHLYPGSARIGIAWYEVDPGYYLLKALSWLGLVWDLRRPSGHTS